MSIVIDHVIEQPAAERLPESDTAPATADRLAPEPRARWERPALAGLLVATAGLYLWGLGSSGWANSFYSAAVQAGSQSWKAWFFGSSDAASSITVDKPPASLWVMGLSVRLFGLSSWSILVPQALMGVATVGIVWATVRRRASAWAAFFAGAVLATTPVAALMFRFNNPDALLVLLMALAAYMLLRGVEDGRRRWIIATGVLIGFGFLTKQLQVLLVVPGFALAYLVAAPHTLRRRITDLLLGGLAMIGAAGWWLAIVELTPASMRPYVGGTQDNSILELTLGYNGLGRLTGDETGSVGGGGGIGGMWGTTGITRMVDGVIGGQVAWLIPAALVGLAVLLWATRRAPRTDPLRAVTIVWGAWLVVTALVFSFMAGIFHEYYTVALAPAIAVLVGLGAHVLWRHRDGWPATGVLASTVAATAVWSAQLLGRADGWNPWLQPLVVTVGGVSAAAFVVARLVPDGLGQRIALGAGIAAMAAALIGPTAWSVQTAATPHTGSIVTAGPAVSGGAGFGPGGGFPAGGPGGGTFPTGGFPTGGFPGGGTPPTGDAMPGGIGGLLDSEEPSQEVQDALLTDAEGFTWAAATIGATRAAGFQLAIEESVMPIGGFNGSDPSPTLEEFQQYVADGEIHWFIAGSSFGPSMGGSDEASAISEWVSANFTATDVDGVTLYDLSGGEAAA